MPSVQPLRANLVEILQRHQLERKFAKQLALFIAEPRHPSLHTEILEPKHRDIYSFRIDRKYRAIFIYLTPEVAEIIAINRHYND
jgi:plasmid maintenance system killer protein